ncbi:MAG: hypothetical protein HC880_09970, partial [Bacteroidia bacterium]|nr:hypothetical protein [Bacteroidia bacterium]
MANFWFDAKERRVQDVLDRLNAINTNLQTAEKLEYIFFKDEIINEEFHKDSTSKILESRSQHIKKVKNDFNILKL